MNNRLKPEIVNVKTPIFSIRDIGTDNAIAAMDRNGQFGTITFDDDLNAAFKPIVENYPAQAGIFKTDPDTKTMWLIAGRGVYTLDANTKAKGHFVVSNDGNARIIESFMADKKNKILLAAANGGGSSYFSLFDTNKNEKIFNLLDTNISYNGILFPFEGSRVLCMLYRKEGEKSFVKWFLSDTRLKTKDETDLTKTLDKYQLVVNDETISYNIPHRVLFAFQNGIYRPTYVVRWDAETKDISATPIIVQMPGWEKHNYSLSMSVSFDGTWMKTTLQKTKEGMFDVPEIFVYHLSDIYPQGISMPIACGLTKEGTDCAFFNHKKFGPCFAEFDIDNPNKLFVYKLNDGLKILVNQVRGATGI